jgi:hypothetical protein
MKFNILITAALLGNINASELEDSEQVIKGILYGTIKAEGLDDILECVDDAEGLFKDIKIVVNDFKKRTAKGTANGLSEIGRIIKVIHSGMKDCSAATGDWKRLALIAEEFSDPLEVAIIAGFNLVINHTDIIKEIETSLCDYDRQKWFDMGENIGEAAVKIFKFRIPKVKGNDQYFLQNIVYKQDPSLQVLHNIFTGISDHFEPLWKKEKEVALPREEILKMIDELSFGIQSK